MFCISLITIALAFIIRSLELIIICFHKFECRLCSDLQKRRRGLDCSQIFIFSIFYVLFYFIF
jgi:hypothetical protein